MDYFWYKFSTSDHSARDCGLFGSGQAFNLIAIYCLLGESMTDFVQICRYQSAAERRQILRINNANLWHV